MSRSDQIDDGPSSDAERQRRHRSFEAGYAGKNFRTEMDLERWAEGVWKRQAEQMQKAFRADAKADARRAHRAAEKDERKKGA